MHRFRQIAFVTTAVFFLLIYTELSAAENTPGRFALVVGNKNYAVAPLKNTINDASAIAEKLESIGFEVTLLTDVTKEYFVDQVNRFYESVQRSESVDSLAMFYYAGHAVQIDHRNYLVPLDFNFNDAALFMDGLIDINDLFAQIPPVLNLQNIVILDACRDNPFDNEADVAIADGLAPLRAPSGTLIAYSTEPGNVAGDGKGQHGTYTKYLLRHLSKRITVEEVFKKVRKDVIKATRKQQIPWEHSSLTHDVFVNPPKNRKMPDLMSF
jgi:uncharacterized caspase-like protein